MRILCFTLCLAILPLVLLTSAAAQDPKILDGKQIFLTQKCDSCHAVSSADIQSKSKTMKTDLAGKLAEKDADRIGDVLRKKSQMSTNKPHPKAFTGSDEELGALIAWLQKQKAS